MASAGVDTTTQGPTPPNGDMPPVTEVKGPTSQGPSEQAVSQALAAASGPDHTQETTSEPITPSLLVKKGAESVRENIHPFFKALHNILKIFRFFTPRGLVEWLVEGMKNKKEMSREATPA